MELNISNLDNYEKLLLYLSISVFIYGITIFQLRTEDTTGLLILSLGFASFLNFLLINKKNVRKTIFTTISIIVFSVYSYFISSSVYLLIILIFILLYYIEKN